MRYFNYKKNNLILLMGILFECISLSAMTDEQVANQLITEVNNAKQKGISFTQTQAHLSLKGNQDKLLKYAEGLSKNKNIINQAIDREKKYKQNYSVFYTSVPYLHLHQDTVVRLYQDIIRKLYKIENGKIGALKDKAFQFLRYTYNDPTYNQFENVNEFLVSEINKNGVVMDRDPRIGTILISTNLSLFGNVGFTGESTWYFFNHPQPWGEIRKDWLEAAIKSYGYSTQYIDELVDLTKYLKDKDGNLGSDLFQIFIPNNLVDQIGYLSWRLGIPFDTKFIMGLFNRPKMTFGLADAIPYPQLEQTTLEFIKKWHDNNVGALQMSELLLNNAENGKFHLFSFLNTYKSNPASISYLNYAQGRLLVTNKYFLNPASGILIYRYSHIDSAQEAIYKIKLRDIIDKMIKEKTASESKELKRFAKPK